VCRKTGPWAASIQPVRAHDILVQPSLKKEDKKDMVILCTKLVWTSSKVNKYISTNEIMRIGAQCGVHILFELCDILICVKMCEICLPA
jgi:hypothetical protein